MKKNQNTILYYSFISLLPLLTQRNVLLSPYFYKTNYLQAFITLYITAQTVERWISLLQYIFCWPRPARRYNYRVV